jgi:uncharacterized protein YbjT (DUF2867 family)
MTFLLLGGTGKTSTRLAALLAAADKSILLASRRGPDAAPNGYPAVKFDWTDESTWSKLFESGPIEAVYLMEPQVDKPWVPMIKFVDLAREKGVGRFVLCGGTTTALGKDGMGRVWEKFLEAGVDFAVLRPCWFMGMFAVGLAVWDCADGVSRELDRTGRRVHDRAAEQHLHGHPGWEDTLHQRG